MRALVDDGSESNDERASRPTHGKLGRYLLRYEIANGGMATVYLAQLGGAQGFGKWVAIKWVHPHLAKDPRFVRMLIDEAKTTSQIDHPAVCQVLDFVEEDGRAYIVMEYLHGESLVSVMRRARDKGGLPVSHAVRIAVQVARGLHAAHESRGPDGAPLGVVHRDVSPHNVHVLYTGGAKVLDFGIALARDRLAEATATDELKGKPAYMAPEQVLSADHDRRVDIWALGVVLWEMLTQERLFRAGNDAQTLMRVLHDEVPPPSKHREGISPALDAVLLRALTRAPDDRFATAAELADALESVMLDRREVATESHVAAWMEELHGDARRLRESLLRARFTEGAGVLAIDLHGRAHPTVATRAADTTVAGRPKRRGHARTLVLGLSVLGTSLLASLAAAMAFRPEPAPTVAVPSVVVAPSAVVVTPPPVVAAQPIVAVTAPAPDLPPPPPIVRSTDAPRERALPPGRLNVLAVPPGEIFFRGERLGATPVVGQMLPAGRQRLEIRWGSVRRVVPVRIRSGELTTLTVRESDD